MLSIFSVVIGIIGILGIAIAVAYILEQDL